jgi:hypothetical protein
MPCVSLAGRKHLSRTKVHGKGDNVGAVGKTYIGRRRPVDREEAVSGREGQGCGKMLCLGLGSWLVIITEKAVVYRLCHGVVASKHSPNPPFTGHVKASDFLSFAEEYFWVGHRGRGADNPENLRALLSIKVEPRNFEKRKSGSVRMTMD